jgi:hypothetical protein
LFFLILPSFVSLLVAESYMVLISALIPYFIVGIAVGAFLNGAYMVTLAFIHLLKTTVVLETI